MCTSAEQIRASRGRVESVESFPSPEEAALDTWRSCPTANARVISVEVREDVAHVVIDTDPSYPDYVTCFRSDDGWIAGASGNGPSLWPDEL